MATWCKELTHWKRPWCWERLKAGGEGDDRGWDGWMASLTQWRWVWINSGSWWWTGKPGMLQSMGLERVGQDWATKLNWTEWNSREGTQLHLLTENWIKDLLSMAQPIITRPSFPLSQSLPSGSIHKPPILLHQRADRLITTVTEN